MVQKIYDILEPVEINSKTYLFMILEYVPNDIIKLLESRSSLNFNEDKVLFILYKMLCSLNFIHSANIMHRDMRPSNFLIDYDCTIKISNFSSARTNPKSESELISSVTTPTSFQSRSLSIKSCKKRDLSKHVISRHYRPPEVILE